MPSAVYYQQLKTTMLKVDMRRIFMAINRKCISGLIGLLVGVTLAGCSSNPAVLLPNPRSPIADVPVPDGFHIVLSKSESTVVPGSGLRIVNEYYKGSPARLTTARFFLHNLPNNGWKRREETQGSGGITEFFKKGDENCTITIRHGWFHTHLYIVITPNHAHGGKSIAPASTTAPAGSS
jgi:hypothetical protein